MFDGGPGGPKEIVMRRSRILAVLVGLGLFVGSVPLAVAQTPSTIVVPAPSAAPTTVVAPSASGTTVIAPPGSTIVVHPPATTTAVIPVTPWCGGAYASPGGTNFGGCPR
jgi:hypothetical protein